MAEVSVLAFSILIDIEGNNGAHKHANKAMLCLKFLEYSSPSIVFEWLNGLCTSGKVRYPL